MQSDVDQIFDKLDLRDEGADRRVAAVLTYLRDDRKAPSGARTRSILPDVRRGASAHHVRHVRTSMVETPQRAR